MELMESKGRRLHVVAGTRDSGFTDKTLLGSELIWASVKRKVTFNEESVCNVSMIYVALIE